MFRPVAWPGSRAWYSSSSTEVPSRAAPSTGPSTHCRRPSATGSSWPISWYASVEGEQLTWYSGQRSRAWNCCVSEVLPVLGSPMVLSATSPASQKASMSRSFAGMKT